jgi:CheY-like chemotaxis protein
MKKILIVEDDQLVATAYRKRFGEAGYIVEWAPDGLEGIKMVSMIKPDVVLLDLLMPRLDGIEVLKYIRTHPDLKNLPVVVFSNSYMTNLVESAWRNGADQCLMKASTTTAQLFDAVGKAM